ncbi:hypothetical protein KQI84_13445 [bacterium]|nr:hypothetical protein [bacterium]
MSEEEVYETIDDLESNSDDRGLLAAAHLALVPLVLMPVLCIAPLSPVAGIIFLAISMPRAGGTRFLATQLAAIELGLLVLGFLGQFLMLGFGANPIWSAVATSAIALGVLIGGVAALFKKGIYRVPVLAGVLFTQFFKGEPMFSGRPQV